MTTLAEFLDEASYCGETIGLDDDLNVYTGSDQASYEACPGEPCDWLPPGRAMPKAEKLLLADLMIDRWTRYKAAVQAEAD